MNENLDLTKILEGCPKGTKLYSTIYGEVIFAGITNSGRFPVELIYYTIDKFAATTFVTKDGQVEYNCNGECTLFPSKEQRDWSKFVGFWDEESLAKSKKGKFDPKTLQPFDKVLVRNADYFEWNACLFSYVGVEEYADVVMCDGAWWNQVIPYNEETKHLCSTQEDCQEYYKWWQIKKRLWNIKQ